MLLSHLFIPLLQTGPVSGTLTQTATASGTVTPTITVSPAVIQAVQKTPIPPLYNIGSVIIILVCLLFVVGVPLLLVRRFGVSLRYMLWGALLGFASQMIVVPLVQQGIGTILNVPANPDSTTLLELTLIGSLIAGAAGALGFFIIYQMILKWDEERTWVGAVMTGAGAAAVLLVIQFGLSSIQGLVSSLQWPLSPSALNQLPDDQKAQLPDIVKTISQLSGYEWVPELWFALTLGIVEIAAAVLVFAYFRRREWTWLAGGAGLLFLAYAAIGIVLYFLSGASALSISIAQIALYTLIAAAGIYFIRRLYEPPEIKTAAPAPATVVDSEAIMPDHSELETPTVSRRKKRR